MYSLYFTSPPSELRLNFLYPQGVYTHSTRRTAQLAIASGCVLPFLVDAFLIPQLSGDTLRQDAQVQALRDLGLNLIAYRPVRKLNVP